MKRLADKVAIVTGGSRGIGGATVKRFVEEGAKVAIFDVLKDEGEALAKDLQGKHYDVVYRNVDITNEREVADAVSAVVSKWGKLDILVNNAAIPGANKFAHEMSVEEWDRVFAVNVRGVFLVTKHAAPLLRKSDDAHIINTNSIVGARPGAQPLPYSVSKGALWTMTKALAGALGPDGIRVNGVAPGWMEGEWMERMLGDNYDKLMDRRAKQTPLRRCVTAEDVADAVMSLITGSKGVSGVILTVDGGFAAVT